MDLRRIVLHPDLEPVRCSELRPRHDRDGATLDDYILSLKPSFEGVDGWTQLECCAWIDTGRRKLLHHDTVLHFTENTGIFPGRNRHSFPTVFTQIE